MAKKKQTKEKKVSYEEVKEKKKNSSQKDTETSSKTRVSRNKKLYTQDQTSTSLKIQLPEEKKKQPNKTNQNTLKEKDIYQKKTKDKESEKKDIKEYNEKNKYQPPIEESKNISRQGLILIIVVLILTIVILVGIDIYHFITFNHNEVKTVTKIKEKKVVDDNIVFLGDSITEYYDLTKFYGEDLPLVNSGINGNKTKDIINNMKERVYDYNPSKIFLLIGTNDFIEQKTTDQISKNIKEIIELIQKNRPYAEIYLESIYPINDTDNKKINHKMVNNRTNKKISKINTELEEYAKENDITYIDIYDKLIDEDGNLDLDYTNEGLHLSEKGYEVVTEELEKYIKE